MKKRLEDFAEKWVLWLACISTRWSKPAWAIAILVGVAFTVGALAADFTVTLNARQTAVLTKVAARITEQRGTNFTVADYIREVVLIDLQQRRAEQDAEDVTPILKAWENASAAEKAAAKTALGL